MLLDSGLLAPLPVCFEWHEAVEELNQSMRFGLLMTATSQDELAKELSRLAKLGILPVDAVCNTKRGFDGSESVGEAWSLAV